MSLKVGCRLTVVKATEDKALIVEGLIEGIFDFLLIVGDQVGSLLFFNFFFALLLIRMKGTLALGHNIYYWFISWQLLLLVRILLILLMYIDKRFHINDRVALITFVFLFNLLLHILLLILLLLNVSESLICLSDNTISYGFFH